MYILYRDDLSYLDVKTERESEIKSMTDLEELKDYWIGKYPHVNVNLWHQQDINKYWGIMFMESAKANLCADTIGELISQGEIFLRSIGGQK